MFVVPIIEETLFYWQKGGVHQHETSKDPSTIRVHFLACWPTP